MKDFRDKYLENRLKNWTAQKRPSDQVRVRLMSAAAATHHQRHLADVWNSDFFEYQPPDWSRFFTSWIVVNAHNGGLTGSRLLA
jgi:hypothetical protein